MTSTADLIAAFAAKGGTVTRVDASATCGLTARQFHLAARDAVARPIVLEIVPLPYADFLTYISLVAYRFTGETGAAGGAARHVWGAVRTAFVGLRNLRAEFDADLEPDMFYYQAQVCKLARTLLEALAVGLEIVADCPNDLYAAMNTAYRAVAFRRLF